MIKYFFLLGALVWGTSSLWAMELSEEDNQSLANKRMPGGSIEVYNSNVTDYKKRTGAIKGEHGEHKFFLPEVGGRTVETITDKGLYSTFCMGARLYIDPDEDLNINVTSTSYHILTLEEGPFKDGYAPLICKVETLRR